MLIIFFQLSRPTAQRIRTRGNNSKCRILKRSNGSRPEAHSTCSSSCVLLSRFFFLFHDNGPAHKAHNFCQFLTPKNVTPLYHPPCSPDLSPPDYFLFPKLKKKLNGLNLADAAEIQEAAADELKEVQKEEFSPAFQKTYVREKNLHLRPWSLF